VTGITSEAEEQTQKRILAKKQRAGLVHRCDYPFRAVPGSPGGSSQQKQVTAERGTWGRQDIYYLQSGDGLRQRPSAREASANETMEPFEA
jgi:hypothetical protein